MRSRINRLAVLLFMSCAVLLTGCSFVNNSTLGVHVPQSITGSGAVYGGARPVSGAHVYLLAANTQGYAGPGLAASATNASVSLLKSAVGTKVDGNGRYYVTTSTSGSFSLSGDYSACTSGQQLYIYSTGGNALGGDPMKTGGNNGVNAAAGMLSILGEYRTVSGSTVIRVNEMTTVAAAYALAGFATDPLHIADDEQVATNTTQVYAQMGTANAFQNANLLVSPITGFALSTTPAGNGSVPTATLNTIANILADCVQSTGTSSTPCGNLFTFTGTATSADTASAAINLAHHPAGVTGSSVTIAKVFADLAPNTAFVPNLTAAPNDFTVAVSLSNLDNPIAIAVYGNGDVWTANSSAGDVTFYTASSGYGDRSIQTFFKTSGNNGIALSTSENAISTSSSGPGCISDLRQSSGWDPAQQGASCNFGTTTLDAIALDGSGTICSPSPGSKPIVTDSASNSLTGSSTDTAGRGIAIDSGNNLWVPIQGGLGEFLTPPPTSQQYTYTHYLDSLVSTPTSVAIDSSNSVWVTNSGNNSLIEFTGSGNTYSAKTPFTGGGLNGPSSVAMDGAGNGWVSNLNSPSISGFSNSGTALSASTGFSSTLGTSGGTNGPLTKAEGIAVDGSGNVWVADYNNATVMFVGLGVPVLTPLAEAATAMKVGTRP